MSLSLFPRSVLPAAALPLFLLLAGAGAEAEGVNYTDYDAVARELLAEMTLAEKVGQMTQADLAGLDDTGDIRRLALGSVLSGGNSDPSAGNTRQAWADAYLACQRAATASRLGVPLVYGVDAVHGHNNVLGAVVFPHNIGLGCANDPDLVERIGRLTALEVRATGIEWTFAPCVTVPRDDRWGRTYEGYSEDPDRVGPLGAALVRGLQGDDLASPTSVLACAKHFVGDGGTTAAIGRSSFKEGVGLVLDQGDTVCDEETLRRVHVAPYLPCLEEGVGTIMPSYSSWNGQKCTSNRALLTGLLKDELGFQGFLISDWDAIDQCHPEYKTAIKLAINAGIDMAMVSKRYKLFIQNLTELVEEGAVPESRIDDAVVRILRVKAAMGLLDPDYQPGVDPSLAESFGSDERRAVAREAVAKSLVLLKNEGTLPLSDSGRVHVTGSAADDLGRQCGGWTIDWQGGLGEVTPGGETILEALRNTLGEDRVTSDTDGAGASDASVALVVVGEKPYAEGSGDDATLKLSAADRAVVQRVAATDTPMALVVVSGRPLVLDAATIEAADAIVAAWLPGTEGAGVADVLLGDVAPSGTLSFTWPRSASQHPINLGDESYEPLYPVGYGLTYEPASAAAAADRSVSP